MFFCLFTLKSTFKTIAKEHNLYSALINRTKCFKSTFLCKNAYCRLVCLKNWTMDIDSKILPKSRERLLQILDAGVSAVLPSTLINNKVKLNENNLIINGKPYPITENVYLVGFGKAVAEMAFSIENILGTRLKQGIISVPRFSLSASPVFTNYEFMSLKNRLKKQKENITKLKRSKIINYLEGAENNQPDVASLANTEKIVTLVQNLDKADTLIVLVSGGGSALLFQPKPPITIDMKRELCRKLQLAGASITELNCVRKQLSTVKGGGLAKIAYPAKVIALILSDIVGDPLEFIASGPTYFTLENEQFKAIDVLQKYKLYSNLENNIKTVLTEQTSLSEETKFMVKEGRFKHVDNVVIGNNKNALRAADKATKFFNLDSIILTNIVEGEVKDLSLAYSTFTKTVCNVLNGSILNQKDFFQEISNQKLEILKISRNKLKVLFKSLNSKRYNKGLLLLFGGEPTVTVKGIGKGGRNQEIALRFSVDWLSQITMDPKLKKYFVLFLSAGTDGQDGPTEAAGAFGHPMFGSIMHQLYQNIRNKLKITVEPNEISVLKGRLKQIEEMLPENVLNKNDSYNFYSKFEFGRNLVKTGLTGTNVMDLHFIYIRERNCKCDFQSTYQDSENVAHYYNYFVFDESEEKID